MSVVSHQKRTSHIKRFVGHVQVWLLAWTNWVSVPFVTPLLCRTPCVGRLTSKWMAVRGTGDRPRGQGRAGGGVRRRPVSWRRGPRESYSAIHHSGGLSPVVHQGKIRFSVVRADVDLGLLFLANPVRVHVWILSYCLLSIIGGCDAVTITNALLGSCAIVFILFFSNACLIVLYSVVSWLDLALTSSSNWSTPFGTCVCVFFFSCYCCAILVLTVSHPHTAWSCAHTPLSWFSCPACVFGNACRWYIR